MSALVIPLPDPAAPPLTSEEFARLYGGKRVEVVRGRIREVPIPASPMHGRICFLIARSLDEVAERERLGRVMTNDSFVRIEESPLTIYGADVSYYSYERLPRGPIPEGVLPVVPELVVEVRSPSETWVDVFGKVVDYLRVGVRAVVILNPGTATADVCRPEVDQHTFTADQELTLPDILPGFAVRVGRLFDL